MKIRSHLAPSYTSYTVPTLIAMTPSSWLIPEERSVRHKHQSSPCVPCSSLSSCPGDAALPPVPGARLPPAGPGRGSRAPAHPPGRQRLQPQVLRAAPIREYPVAMLPPWADMISATRRGFYFGIIEIPERHISADETSL